MVNIRLFSIPDRPDFQFYPSISKNRKAIVKILQDYSSPVFIVDPTIVSQKIDQLYSYFQDRHQSIIVAYSSKTNYSLCSSPILKELKTFLEVVSYSEYHLARKNHFAHRQIVFNGPYKEHLSKLLSYSFLLHIDNFTELEQIIRYSRHKIIKAKLGLRVNTSKCPSRFGFNIENGQAAKAINLLTQENIKLSSIHFHQGHYPVRLSDYQSSLNVVTQFIHHLYHKYQITLDFVDFGGSLPSHSLPPYHAKKFEPNYTPYLSLISHTLKQLPNSPTLILEPGRYLIDDATIFITKVIHSQVQKSLQQVTVNATINQIPLTWTRPNLIKAFSSKMHPYSHPTLTTTVFGASCQEADILFQGNLPLVKPGDYIIVFASGAYNQNMSSDFIFPRPPTIFL